MSINPAFNLIGLNDLRSDPRYRNIDGQVDSGPQLAVAILDTGIYGSHPLIDGNFLAYGDFIDNNSGRAIAAEDVVFTNEIAVSEDRDGHGTHVAGTIGAEDDRLSVAPGVKLLGLNVIGSPFTQNTTNADVQGAVNNGLQWVRDNRQLSVEGRDYRIVSVNMSLGFYGKANSLENAPYALQGIFTSKEELNNRSSSSPEVKAAQLTRELENAGIAVVSATGNDYSNHAQLRQLGQTMPNGGTIPVQNVSTPAISSTIAAGSLHVQRGEISNFSQRLNIDSMLHAPGGDVLSTVSPDGDNNGDGLEVLSGTSMASPHIAGAITLMQDAALTFGDRVLSSEEVRQILLETADIINDGDDENYSFPTRSTGENFRRLNIYQAVREIDRRFNGTTSPDPQPNPEPNPRENDPNGSINNAISLENDLGKTISTLTEFTIVTSEAIGADGSTQVGGSDVDLISFNVPETGGLVTIETTANNSGESVDTILRLFDSEGNEIAIDDDGGDDRFSRIEASLTSGTYYAGISGYNNLNYNPNVPSSGTEGNIGTYNIGWQFQSEVGGGSGGDRNGTIDSVATLPFLTFSELSTQTAGSIIGSDPIPNVSDRVSVGRTDIDFFGLEVTTAGLIVIETTDGDLENSENLDSVLRLFNAEGNELAIDDDGGDDRFSRLELALEVGTYYLGVSGYDNLRYDPNSLEGRSEGSIGTVNITFDFQPEGNQDPNGIRNGATELELLPGEVTSLTGEIGTDFDIEVNAQDVDLVTFTPTRDATLLIDIDTPFGAEFNNDTDDLTFADTYLRFFDGNGLEIASSDDDFAENIAGTIVESEIDSSATNSFGDSTQDQFGNLIGHDVDSFLRVNVTAGETYYVGISAFGNESYSIDDLDNRNSQDSGGLYQLLITNITTPDADGSIGQAPTLEALSSNRINGNIGFDEALEVGDSDIDIYEYTPTQRGLLQLDIDAFSTLSPNDAVDSLLFLFDDRGNELAFNDDESVESFDSHLEYLVEGGSTYYIAVAGYGNGDFDSSVTGSGESGDTGDYTLNIDLLQPQTPDSGSSENSFAAAFADFLAGDRFSSQVDIDRDIFGSAFSSLDTSSLNSLTLGTTVTSFLGEDPQSSENIFSSFSDLYSNQASLAFGSSSIGNITNGGLPEDADYFLLPIAEAGRYDLRTLVGNTEVGSIGTQTNLRLYNSDLEAIDINNSDFRLSGVDSRLVVEIQEPGDYWVVVLPDGSAAERFDFSNHSFGELSPTERQEFANSLGEYALSSDRFVLQADSEPFFYNGTLTLQLNDRIDTAELDADSVTVLDSSGNAIPGSIVARDNGNLIFVPNNPLSGGEYTVTYNSDRLLTQNTSFINQRKLDGDGDGTPGGDLVASFNVEEGEIYVSVPNFGRTPGQAINIRGAGLPISVSDGEGFQDIRLRVDYNSELLEITDATLADGLPDDWSISQIDIAYERIIVDLAGTTPLNAGDTELVRLNATVPETASTDEETILQVSGGAIAGGNNSIIFEETAAVHNLRVNSDDEGDRSETPESPTNTIELFRFRNTSFTSGTYVFVGEAERDAIQNDPNFSQTFALDGVQDNGDLNPAFKASLEPGADLIPFYRLKSIDVSGTFLFVSTEEYNGIFANDSNQRDKWEREGLDENGSDIPEFYLFDGSADRGVEFNRFQNTQNGTFLYAGAEETRAINSDPNLSSLFRDQGTAFESLI